jgi:DNA-binding PadR family transcriptional regulator
MVLASLIGDKDHGYDLARKLAGMKIFREVAPDASGVYKTLKIMEKEGLVTSVLDSDSGGPAKRSYALTAQGRQCLRRWIGTLRDYRRQMDRLLTVLESAVKASAKSRKSVKSAAKSSAKSTAKPQDVRKPQKRTCCP